MKRLEIAQFSYLQIFLQIVHNEYILVIISSFVDPSTPFCHISVSSVLLYAPLCLRLLKACVLPNLQHEPEFFTILFIKKLNFHHQDGKKFKYLLMGCCSPLCPAGCSIISPKVMEGCIPYTIFLTSFIHRKKDEAAEACVQSQYRHLTSTSRKHIADVRWSIKQLIRK